MRDDSKREWINSTIAIVSVIFPIISFKLFQVTIVGFGKLLLISIPLGIIVFALLYKKIKESESFFDIVHILTLFFTVYIVGELSHLCSSVPTITSPMPMRKNTN